MNTDDEIAKQLEILNKLQNYQKAKEEQWKGRALLAKEEHRLSDLGINIQSDLGINIQLKSPGW